MGVSVVTGALGAVLAVASPAGADLTDVVQADAAAAVLADSAAVVASPAAVDLTAAVPAEDNICLGRLKCYLKIKNISFSIWTEP